MSRIRRGAPPPCPAREDRSSVIREVRRNGLREAATPPAPTGNFGSRQRADGHSSMIADGLADKRTRRSVTRSAGSLDLSGNPRSPSARPRGHLPEGLVAAEGCAPNPCRPPFTCTSTSHGAARRHAPPRSPGRRSADRRRGVIRCRWRSVWPRPSSAASSIDRTGPEDLLYSQSPMSFRHIGEDSGARVPALVEAGSPRRARPRRAVAPSAMPASIIA